MVYILDYDGAEITRQAYKPTRSVGVPKPDGSTTRIPPGHAGWRTEPDPPGPTAEELAAQAAEAEAARDKRFAALRTAARDVPGLATAIEALLT